ncbi:MAG: ABC transporter substrate-binding protein [Bacteroidales bacterium]|nr:ABC transporter substrate-binding protein [Bacteroidales bacterium]MDY4557891.1 ABC transporter substrate-binding protein [Alloprevotella sp.]
MSTLFKGHSLFLIALLLLMSCQKQAPVAAPQPSEAQPADTVLRLALVPNRDCLPFYYAGQSGIFRRLGLHVQITTYRSQLECDTALLGQSADVGWTEPAYLQAYGKKAGRVTTLWQTATAWQLYVPKKLRIAKVKDIAGRTVAASRHSAALTTMEQALKKVGIQLSDVYCTQVNNLKLRTGMLTSGQVDAAMLCWPYGSWASAGGCKVLYTGKAEEKNGCFVAREKWHKLPRASRQVELLQKARNMALDSLRQKGNAAYSAILQREYGLPASVADTIKY